MKIAFLPNWCKYLSLTLFIASFALGINDFYKGFEDGRRATQMISTTHSSEPEQAQPSLYDAAAVNDVSLIEYLSDTLLILSMIVYILSKDKNDDEYINVLRGKSLLIALLIGLISCFIAYAFGCYIQGLWLLLIQFLSYIIVFKISKVVANAA